MVAMGYAQGGVAGISDWPAMYATYPDPSCARIFVSTGNNLPAWSSTSWNVHPTSTFLIISWKVHTQDVSAWLDALPVARQGKVALVYHHEPEQDMTAAEFKTRFDAILNSIDGHSNREHIWVGPILTSAWQYQNGNGANWSDWWSTTMQAKCDFIGWDVYNRAGTVPSDYPLPLSPDHSNGITLKLPVQSSNVVEKPWILGEWGTRRTAADTTGAGAATWMRTWVDTMADEACAYATWWHDSGNDLTDLNRTAEIAELQYQVANYTTPGTYPPAGSGGGGTPPAVIEFVADGQNINTAAATSLPVTAPAGVVDGDLLVGWFGWLSTTVTASQPAEFTVLGSQADGSSLTGRILHRTAASEPASYAFAVSSAVKAAAWVGAYRGVDPAAPIYDWALTPGDEGTSHTTPAVDVPAGGWLVYGAVTRHTPGATGATTWTSSGTDPQERYEAASNAGSADITFVVYDTGVALDAAADVTRTLTSSQAEDALALFAVALKPDATPPGGGGEETTTPTPGLPIA